MKLTEKRRDRVIMAIGLARKPLTVLKHRLDTLRKQLWYDEGMMEGKCPKCGTSYFGWALRFPRHQMCPKCGVGLQIIENGQPVARGYSPFTAKKHSTRLSPWVPSLDDGEKKANPPQE